MLLFAATSVSHAQQATLRRGNSRLQARPVSAANDIGENSTLTEKRAWLEARMLREFSDVDRQAEIRAKVAQMSPERIDALMKIYQKRPEIVQQLAENESRRQLAASQAYRDYLVRQYQNRLAASRRRGVGYAPVITWLPEGTSLGASAVVSPDRRYVRITAQPFFSRVDRVDTFNFYTGETRTIQSGPVRRQASHFDHPISRRLRAPRP
jgi:hypothetical protein